MAAAVQATQLVNIVEAVVFVINWLLVTELNSRQMLRDE